MRKLLVAAALLSAVVPAIAQARWYQATSEHFVVYSDDTPERVKAYTEKLERFDKAVSAWHVTKEIKRGPAARVTIFVVGDIDDVQRLINSSSVAGFYIPREQGPVAFMPRSGGGGELSAQAILFHEYTHHWMFSNWTEYAAFPYWFTEGFAELHATAKIQPDGSVMFGAQPMYRRWTVGRTYLLPASDLLHALPGSLDGPSTDALYSRGWLLMNYLTFDPDRRKQLGEYIVALNSGKSIDEASKIFGSMNTLDVKMNAWGKRAQIPTAVITPEQINVGTIETRPLTDGEAAVMPALIQSTAGVNEKKAADVVALARRAAAPYPNDAGAQNEVAEAEFDYASTIKSDTDAVAGFQRAEAAADRAIAADPKSIHALIYKGLAQEEIAKRGKVTDPAKWQAIRKWFLTANKVDTESPEPLVQYYDSFEKAGEKPTLNAQNGLLYAYALAPYDGGLRVKATKVFLCQGKFKEARTAIAPIAYSSEERGMAERGQKILAAIDANDATAALKILNEKPEDKKKDGKDGK